MLTPTIDPQLQRTATRLSRLDRSKVEASLNKVRAAIAEHVENYFPDLSDHERKAVSDTALLLGFAAAEEQGESFTRRPV
jgi:hypothetical protein